MKCAEIVDIKNWVIHGYDKVNDYLMWVIITNHLPKLREEIEKLLNENS